MGEPNLNKEIRFFHDISPKILAFTKTASRKIKVLKINTPAKVEFATVADIAVEKMITDELKRIFPHDHIIAEESTPDMPKDFTGRYWLIDPICGTTNFSRGSNLYATNIALALDGELIAACVVDHNEGTYIWSAGDGSIYSGQEKLSLNSQIDPPYIIEVDFPAVNKDQAENKSRVPKLVKSILHDTNFYIASYATSLAFTRTAMHRIDAYVVPRTRVWDVAAPNFLTRQSGGVVTTLDGKPWTLFDTNVLGARDITLHTKLLHLLRN